MTANADLAKTFHALHRGPELLVLANAWDAGSARLIESLGAKAIATTSAGVAWALGYQDGDAVPVRLLAATVALITRVIRVPLTVDAESGYSPDPATVGETVASLIDAGAVGINIEDGANPPDLLCAKIERAKQAGTRLGVDLFVNARIDVYLRGLAPKEQRVEASLARARRYRDAGADGIFVPGMIDPGEIKTFAGSIDRPFNVMARPGLPPAAELARLGVRRLSAGTGVAQGAWGRAAALARGFLAEGRSEALSEGAMTYPELNALMTGR